MNELTKTKPNLFIVGAGKAGTSALATYLNYHPDVFMSSVKEPNYFGNDLQFRVPRLRSDDYINLFSRGFNCKYRGEASVSYLLSSTAAQEIREFSNDAKIIIMVRNPIEIVQARHAQNLLKGTETIIDLERALDVEPERRNGACIPQCAKVIDWLFYSEWARLATQLERYLTVFGRKSVFVGVFDDFKKDPEAFYRSLLKFLDLAYIPPGNFALVNTRKRSRSYWLSRFLHGRKASWQGKLVRMLVPSHSLRRALAASITRYNEAPKIVQDMPGHLRKRLEKEFEAEVVHLGRILGRDLTAWISSGSLKCKGGARSEWPIDGLESVPNCPVCGACNRKLLHEGLTDKVFFCAPGKWSMYSCESCASAYLDPRPTPETIALAYQRYYTHEKAPIFSSLSFLRRLRRRLANGYRNHYYGTQDFPASYLGILVTSFMPNGRAIIGRSMRQIPKVKGRQRLLDLGCGNGAFLMRVRSAGWNVVGADFDVKAVEAACSQGLDVRLGGVEIFKPANEQFDVITLAHVIEHVHHPVKMLQACNALLKPGGFLWIETPNITAEGHRLFGVNWRGLEPPRHLVLFTLESMSKALNAAGFSEVKVQPYRPLCEGTFGASKAIAEDLDPYSDAHKTAPSDMVKKAERIARANPERREFITVKAWKK